MDELKRNREHVVIVANIAWTATLNLNSNVELRNRARQEKARVVLVLNGEFSEGVQKFEDGSQKIRGRHCHRRLWCPYPQCLEK